MNRYIALLRGINVGGYRKIKMDELRAMFESMQFENVTTYIQSGNVVFDAPPTNAGLLSNQITKQIETTFGYQVPVTVRTVDELKTVLDELPFNEKPGWKLYFSFLPKNVPQDSKQKLAQYSSDIEQFRVGDRIIYSLVDKTSDRNINFSNGFIEKLVKMPCTTRNLRTAQKLLEIAKAST